MNTSNWQGFHSRSRLARFLAWLTRGETPVDGCTYLEPRSCLNDESRRAELARGVHEAEEAGSIPRAPVRWGNYR